MATKPARIAFEIVLAPEALDDLRALKAYHRTAVLEGIERHLRHSPGLVSRSRIKRLRGIERPQFRLRVDDIRVFYDVAGDRVEILAIVEKSEAAAWLAKHASDG